MLCFSMLRFCRHVKQKFRNFQMSFGSLARNTMKASSELRIS